MKDNNIAPERSIYHAVLALALAGSCAFAQSENTTSPAAEETELAPITVSAHEGIAVPYDQTGVSVTVLDVEELKKEGIYTLTEALTTVPGVYVLPGGGTAQRGNASPLVIRGMSSQKYVLPMMDGMRLGGLSARNGIVASEVVARTPLFGVGALELVRGAQGAVYGNGAMSGVLFMETPEGQGDPSLSLFNEYGSFDSYTGNVTAQGRVKDDAYYFSATYEHTNNDLRFLDGSGAKLKHAGKYENWSEALRLDHDFNDRNKLTFTYRREDSSYRSYSAPSNWGGADTSIYAFRTNLVTARFQSKVSEKFSTGLMVGYYGSDKVIGAKGSSDSPWYYDLDNVQVEWRNVYQWNEAHRTTAGLAWSRSDFETKNEGDVQRSDSNLDSVLSAFAEHTVQPVENWESSLALRLDQSNAYDSLFTLRASSNYKFNRERSRVFASFGRGYAAPGEFEKSKGVYKSPWNTYYGNPNLKCETNWSADLGAEQAIAKNHFASATLFWIRSEDAIDTTPVDDGRRYINLPGHQTNQGVELALRGTFEEAWQTGYKVACTIAQPKTSDDKQVAGSARQMWTADVHTSPIKGLTTGLGLAAASRRVGWNGGHLDNYLTLRWYANYEVNERLSVHVRVENLTNQKFVPDEVWGNAANATLLNPGTAVYAGCTVKF